MSLKEHIHNNHLDVNQTKGNIRGQEYSGTHHEYLPLFRINGVRVIDQIQNDDFDPIDCLQQLGMRVARLISPIL